MAEWTPAILILGIAATVFYHGLRQIRAGREAQLLGNASLQWPKVMGQITASSVQTVDLGDSVGYCLPVVAYSYSVGSMTYLGSAISFRNPQSTKKAATAIAAKYPVGSEVAVSYDPNNACVCVLEPGTEGAAAFFMWGRIAIGVAIALALAAVAVPILRRMYP